MVGYGLHNVYSNAEWNYSGLQAEIGKPVPTIPFADP
jgi:hypothetical protein